MNAFDHITPQSLPEALEILAQFNGQGHVIAGGTDLMLKMRSGALSPEMLVNIKQLAELKGQGYDPNKGLVLGALTTLRDLTRSPLIQNYYPSLAQTAGQMASEQIRSFATVGGNLSNGSPSADLAPPLITLGGKAHITGLSGDREVLLEEFFRGPGSTALEPGELLKEIRVPPPAGNVIFLKHAPRAFMEISLVCVAVHMQLENRICEQVRIVLGAVAPTPLRARNAEAILEGRLLTDDRLAQAASAASQECSPIDDEKASGWYRRRMVQVLIRRSLTRLRERAL